MTELALKSEDFISIKQTNQSEIESILELAEHFKRHPVGNQLEGKVLATCFFEPSTRTRLSFESAMIRLGGKVIGFSETHSTSAKKGETLSDTIKVVEAYADVIVIRHPEEGSAQLAAEASKVPVINAGDGSNQHPTQTLLDLFSIKESQGRLHDLHIAFAGDLKYSRTVHSLINALGYYNPRIYMIAPPNFHLSEDQCEELKQKGVVFSFHHTIEEVIDRLDVIYMTRFQKERHASNQSVTHGCILNGEHLKSAKENFRVLHPLPRVDEITTDVDESPYAYYFEQSSNGVPVRQALLTYLLGSAV